MKFLKITLPIFWILLMVDAVGTAAATYDYIKISNAQTIIIQNQNIQAQRSIDYINCLININPKMNVPQQERDCLVNGGLPRVKQ